MYVNVLTFGIHHEATTIHTRQGSQEVGAGHAVRDTREGGQGLYVYINMCV